MRYGMDTAIKKLRLLKKSKYFYSLLFFSLIIVSLLALVISFTVGYYHMPLKNIYLAINSYLKQGELTSESIILFRVRLPRIIAAFLIGAALSVSGSAYQGMFKNPLVSPDILGVSAGAGFGAAWAIVLGLPYYLVQVMAFLFGLLVVFLSNLISRRVRFGQTLTLILAGTMFSALSTAGTTLLKYISEPSDTLPAITFWLMGSLAKVSWNNLLFSLPPMLIGFCLLYLLRWRLNLLTLGDEEARSLGMDPVRTRKQAILGATFLSAAAVCLGGLIGWVGLMIPHIARTLIGPQYRRLLPVSGLLGGCFLLIMDDLARSLFVMEIPLGVMTACLGAPFFMLLILKDREG